MAFKCCLSLCRVFPFTVRRTLEEFLPCILLKLEKRKKKTTLNPVQFNQFNINLGIIHSNFLNLVFFQSSVTDLIQFPFHLPEKIKQKLFVHRMQKKLKI